MTNGLPFAMLVVDDDEDDRIFLDEAFLQLGYDAEVKKFKDASGLFHYLESIDNLMLPSLIVLDNQIAEQNALTIIDRLYTQPRFRDIPIIVCSSMLSPAKQRELLASGVYACFEKGDNMEETVDLAKKLKKIAQSKTVAR
jgi:CheY-like chemotaxis protein